ncbi:sensor histidine kinase [Actinospica durhamensis]|uniref:histidine kinase n=1 Tax=Actinospica durhamensis TaxID=1508375 RepID=A0A941IS48_9ACTN|nr:sensor histidine kinase [Actinospica durhamensis]MBR7838094.1 sensor histidine kinase [Actinospica durhamensis]
MEQAFPRPPLLKQIPRYVWNVLLWGAAGLYATAICLGRVFLQVPNGHPVSRDLSPSLWVALSLLLAAPVGAALRRPVSAFCLLLVESAAAVVFTSHTPWEWLLVLAAMDALLLYLAAVRPRRISILAATLALAAQVAEIQCSNIQGKPPFQISAVPLASVILAAWSIGNSVRQHGAYAEALRIQAAAQAVTAERLRIARELHDQVAHDIGVIAIQAGAAGLILDTRPEHARTALSVIEVTSRETLAGLRRMLVSLRRAEADEYSTTEPAVGLEALPRLADRSAAAGVEVQVAWNGARRPLPPEVDLAAFRIIQEAVTNVVRHSTARQCLVHVEFRPAELVIDVLDEGRGEPRDTPARTAAGFGIAGMRERVALLGGLFSAGPRPEGGFQVTARLPA